jgi:hypothetical protein
MSSAPPASNGMMWSASVAGALWQMVQVWGPVAKSSLRALLNSGVARRVMLFRFFSSALGWRLRLLACYGMSRCGISPPQFELLTQAVGCALPADSHLDICDVWTLYPCLGMGLYPRSRVLHLLSTTPNEAMVLICCRCLGAVLREPKPLGDSDVTCVLGALQSSPTDLVATHNARHGV